MKSTFLTALLAASFMSAPAMAAKPNANAPKGGVMNYNLESQPESLHPIMAGDTYSSYVHAYVMDTLCGTDPNTYVEIPALAEKWEVSKNGLEFTFTLRKDAYFHNGENVTADDVKFSLDAIREPKHQALNLISYYEKITKAEVLDKHKIKFTVSEPYFKNLQFMCGITVIPKSVYGDINKSVKMQSEVIGSGPYKLKTFERGQRIVLEKFDKWYGDKDPETKGYYNFKEINFRITKDETVIIEKLKKGDIDFHYWNTADGYLKAKGSQFGKTVFANKVENKQPKALRFIGFNFKREILKDKNVRLAFAHLVNREEMNKKFFDGLQYLATSPVYVKSDQSPDIKPIPFDVKVAKDLLTKAGWKDEDKNGVLEKEINGKKTELRVTFIYARKESEKWWTTIREDMKKAGIDLQLQFLEWNSFIKNIDEQNFDLMAMAWGGGSVEADPKQIWHSSSIGKGGSNYISYSNPEVDKLIDQARTEMDYKKRSAIFKKTYGMIAEDVPYIFLFNPKYEFYANSNKVSKPGESFVYAIGQSAWWSAQK